MEDKDKVSLIGKNHFGDGPYPVPLQDMNRLVDIYQGSGLCIIIPKHGIDFLEKSQHVHNSYEFIIPYNTMHFAGVESSNQTFEQGKIFPINAGQYHGPRDIMLQRSFDTLSIDKEFLQDIALSLFRKKNVFFTNQSFTLPNYVPIIYREFIYESQNCQSGYQFMLDCLATQMVIILLRYLPNNVVSLEKEKTLQHRNGIKRAVDFIRECYYTEYSLEKLSQVANLSPYHFIRLFKLYTGKTPYDYVIHLKVEKAKELLRKRDSTITQVCFQCGFNNHSHFTTLFKKRTGVTPSQYKKFTVD